MAAQLLLDHSSISKSRRALIISSVGLLVLTRLDIKTDFIELFDLKLGVDQRQLIIFGLIGVIYFGYIFTIYGLQNTSFYVLKEHEKIIKEGEGMLAMSIKKRFESNDIPESVAIKKYFDIPRKRY